MTSVAEEKRSLVEASRPADPQPAAVAVESPPSAAATPLAPTTIERSTPPDEASTTTAPDLQTTIVDPLERTRAALADARRQMPGILGTPAGEEGDAASERHSVRAGATERAAIDWRGLIAELQSERRQLADEVAGLHGLVIDLRGEVSRLAEIVAAVRTAPPLLDLPAQPPVATPGAELSEGSVSVDDSRATGSTAGSTAADHDRPWLADGGGHAPPVPPQDFGWRFRPESLQSPAISGEWQPPEAADFEHEEGAVGPSDKAEPHAAGGAAGEHGTEFVPHGGRVSLIAGPLSGVRQVAAIEGCLAGVNGVGPLQLVSFRGREASFRIGFLAPTSLAAIRQAVEEGGGNVAGCVLDAGSQTIRMSLNPVSAESTGPA